jgi:two-component system LytT family response regulator
MNCIVVDDEPLAREAMVTLIRKFPGLELLNEFSGATAAAKFLETESVDIIFLDIQMPGTDGITFAQSIPQQTMVIFTTAYSQYALESYEIDALDYLIKPIRQERFERAVSRALSYKRLLETDTYAVDVNDIQENYFFIRAERKVFKVFYNDILFIQGLKDYVVLFTADQKVITAMNIKTIQARLPQNIFIRTSKSYIINKHKITSFDNNTVYIEQHEIPIGNTYHTAFFEDFVTKRLLTR